MQEKLFSWFLPVAFGLIVFGSSIGFAELHKFSNVRLLDRPDNLADSFWVEFDGGVHHLRLYYVDSPKAGAGNESEIRRLREQAGYWRLGELTCLIAGAEESNHIMHLALQDSFRLYTAFAQAPGRADENKIYAFVTTAAGDDLATLLVGQGLARTRGVGRMTPDGLPRAEMIARLRDFELMAAVGEIGLWGASDPDFIAALRRDQGPDLTTLHDYLYPVSRPDQPLDPNQASEAELQQLPGIGPIISERIVQGRPYADWSELIEVKGIGPLVLEKISPFLTEVE